ncbi:hypothetical protein BegalDRAFT_1227 [Beggiatoa alba B18LD]|uniref:Transposase (putative) YhgA-like domain-containing protein n=1 Tax=Beggiatoa alba B18LD TaxID=395493 RepID=I3CET4_9GAMM|nr:Rpn family recombination-promoting nuclease/putative transposase [Beggiatoa alba]EIJ42127.1 hypothetical protein BegalDRAFT_1227 [Beggiatoa alba B18LD]
MKTIHDRGYKRLFSNKTFFRQLLQSFVPEPWVQEIDFESSERLDKSFVSQHYKETESDLIYRVKFKGEEAYVYILLEFQSRVVWFMALRVLHYICSFWLDYAESHPKIKKLPPIFPIVLYNGEKRWTAHTNLRDILEKPELLDKYTPDFRFFKIAENEYPQERLLQIKNVVSTLFLAETYPNDIELLKTKILDLFDDEAEKEATSLLLNWFLQLVEHGRRPVEDYTNLEQVYQDKYEVKEMLDRAMEQMREKFKAEGRLEGILEGRREGKREGRREGLEEGVFKGKAEALITLLETRFAPLTIEEKERLFQLSHEKLIELLIKFYQIDNVAAFWREIETH